MKNSSLVTHTKWIIAECTQTKYIMNSSFMRHTKWIVAESTASKYMLSWN